MNKNDAHYAVKQLTANDFRDAQIVKDGSSWTVFATGNEGTRIKFETIDKVNDRIAEIAFLRETR